MYNFFLGWDLGFLKFWTLWNASGCSLQFFDWIFFFFCFTGENNELDAVSAFSEIVPDTVVFDDFER